jgi:hypothetical protein
MRGFCDIIMGFDYYFKIRRICIAFMLLERNGINPRYTGRNTRIKFLFYPLVWDSSTAVSLLLKPKPSANF